MLHSKFIMSGFRAAMLFAAFCLMPSLHTAQAEADNGSVPVYSPVVNTEALRGLTTVGSAESMGAGRLTFNLMVAGFHQKDDYLTAPNVGANIFTGVGAFSYGVNSYVDVFASIAGFGGSNYTNTNNGSGLGTIRAGVQGSLPFPTHAYMRLGGQLVIMGGTSQNQINTFREDGYNYFETRTEYSFMGKLMQTFEGGNTDYGIKLHLNEAGVIGISKSEPTLLLLGAGLQGNLGVVVLGAEINSRTRFNDMQFSTDPLWFTPSIHLRTPYMINVMAGADVCLSEARSGTDPKALEPYRVFGAVEVSMDLLAGKRKADLEKKQKAAQDKADMENKAAQSANQIQFLGKKSMEDSLALVNEKQSGRMEKDSMQRKATADSVVLANEKRSGRMSMDSLQRKADADALANKTSADALAKKAVADSLANKTSADALAQKATADSLALVLAASNLAAEKAKRTDAEKQLLSTGALLLDAVYFETGKTTISINSKPYLNIIGKMLLKYPKLQIEVAGHTDNVGGESYNMTLSQGRADAVRDYLVEKEPALSSTTSARGYGLTMPKASNNTKDGRLKNRRVELRVMNLDALQEYNK